jgi:hypothetical protein
MTTHKYGTGLRASHPNLFTPNTTTTNPAFGDHESGRAARLADVTQDGF